MQIDDSHGNLLLSFSLVLMNLMSHVLICLSSPLPPVLPPLHFRVSIVMDHNVSLLSSLSAIVIVFHIETFPLSNPYHLNYSIIVGV